MLGVWFVNPDVNDVTVVVPTIPERAHTTLLDCLGSIETQTVQPAALIVEPDPNHVGVVTTVNRAAARVETEWLFPFGDDDLMYPNHFEVLGPELERATKELGADVVYTWCRVTGAPGIPEDVHQVEPPFGFVAFRKRLRERNFVPGAAAIRSSLWRYLGGYREPPPLIVHEDWDFWLRAVRAGVRFHCVPVVTWEYRASPAWQHRSGS